MSDKVFDSLVKGVPIPGTTITIYIDLDGYFVILDEGSSIDFRNSDISVPSDDTAVSSISIPSLSLQNSLKEFSEKYSLPIAQIHITVMYSS